MIEIGKYSTLTIMKETLSGLFLCDDKGEEVLLPFKHAPKEFSVGEDIKVFIYQDKEGRKIATTQKSKITLNDYAKLKVTNVTDFGAFLDWGMDKELFVPKSESREPLFSGEVCFFTLRMDPFSNRLFASNKIEKYLMDESITVLEKDQVDLLIYRETDIGFLAIINNKFRGIIYKNEIFNKKLAIGDRLDGWVKKIREDNKIDLSITPIGYRNFADPVCDSIIKLLNENNGFLPLTDKSEPNDIYDLLSISKKVFKKAIGALYRERKIIIEDNGIRIINQ